MSGSHSSGSDDSARESSGVGDGTGETEIYSQAYSAPESEHFTIAPYVPPEPALYDYDSYEAKPDADDAPPPRWPWVVGVVAIIAAISLTMRRREGAKYQNPAQQVRVSRDDRVRLVRMAAEKKP